MRQTKRLTDIHQEAKREFDRIQSVLRDERTQCVEDRRFYSIAGAQWEGKLGDQFKNKPKFEVNKIHLAVIRIINEYRNNRITVNFISKNGEEHDKLASTCDDLYRADEEDSSAEEAYDNGFEEAVGGGFGAFRLRTEYEDEYDEENEKQRIRIEPIYDADTSVFFDLNAKKYDKSDAKCCFVITSHTVESYEEEWGEDPTSWPKEIMSTSYFDWATPQVAYIAEYYRVEETMETIFIYKTIDGEEEKYYEADFEEDEELETRLNAIGTMFERERKIKTRRIRKYIMSGSKILKDCGYIAGKHIPIVPIYGKRWYIDNIERCMGHVRLAKDVQRLKNMQTSKLAEISALSTVEKPVLTPEQITGHENMWASDNIENHAFLLINSILDEQGNALPSGPVAYTKVPNVPPAMAALLQLTDSDIKEILGNQEVGEKMVSNIAEDTVLAIQTQLGMQTYIYMSNFAKSVKRAGQIWLSMAQEVFVEEGRKLKGIGEKDNVRTIELMKSRMNPDTGKIEYDNDLSNANFDVTVSVGPSSVSRRAATVKELTNMMQLTQDPETLQVLTGMAMMNMEGEGIDDVREYFRDKMLKMGVVRPTEEEAQELAAQLENQQPSPQDQYFMAEAERAEAEGAKNRADTILTVAKAEETRAKTEETKAKTLETLSGIESEEENRAIEALKTSQTIGKQSPQL